MLVAPLVGAWGFLHAASGIISGNIYDASTHMPLAGANIIILNTELGAAANDKGSFTIYGVPVGTYSVEASMVGYRPQVKTQVVIKPNHVTEITFMVSEDVLEMSQIVVRADYFSKVKDAPVSERSFSNEEIQTQPGSIGDISRVVQAMPAVVSTGDQDNEIIVRGGSPNENLFLVDGIELPYPNHLNQRGEQGGGISILNSLLIRDIEFIAGAYPARYGDRASSVMNVFLNKGQTGRLAGNIDMNMAGLGGIVEGSVSKNVSLLGSMHRSYLDLLIESGILEMDVIPRYNHYLGKLTYTLSPADELSLVAVYADDEAIAEPGEGVFDEDYAYDYATERYACGVSWQRLFGTVGFGKLLVSTARMQWDGFSQEVIDSIRGDTLDKTWASEEYYGAQYDATLRFAQRHETQFGVSVRTTPFSHKVFIRSDTIYVYTYNQDSIVTDSFPYRDDSGNVVVQGGIDEEYSAQAMKLGAYIQHKVALGSVGNLTLGLRADYFDYTNKQYLSPRVGFVSKPFIAGISFTAGYGRHYQSPAYHILLSDSAANHHLESQRAEHYVAGLEKLLGNDTKLTVEAYYKEMENQHIPLHWTTRDPYDWSTAYVDIGSGTAKGIEFFLQKKFSHNWHGTISYSLSEANMANPQEANTMIPADFDYRHVFTILGAYKTEFRKFDWYKNMPGWLKYTAGILLFSDEADIGLRFRYMGGRPYTPMQWRSETRQWIENGDLLNSERLPPYHRLDVRWDHKYLFNRWSLSWYIEIQNVYDRKNLWWYNYKDDGTVDEVYQFRFFPVIGFVVQF